MSKENSLNKTEDNSNSTKQFIGLVIVTAIVIAFFCCFKWSIWRGRRACRKNEIGRTKNC